MIKKDRNPGDRIIKRPSVINVEKVQTDPNVINNVNHIGIIPSTDLLINALQTVPVPYGVVSNKPATSIEGPNIQYMQNFKDAYLATKYIDNIAKS